MRRLLAFLAQGWTAATLSAQSAPNEYPVRPVPLANSASRFRSATRARPQAEVMVKVQRRSDGTPVALPLSKPRLLLAGCSFTRDDFGKQG